MENPNQCLVAGGPNEKKVEKMERRTAEERNIKPVNISGEKNPQLAHMECDVRPMFGVAARTTRSCCAHVIIALLY